MRREKFAFTEDLKNLKMLKKKQDQPLTITFCIKLVQQMELLNYETYHDNNHRLIGWVFLVSHT